MSVLVAFALGGRPRTAYVMQAALQLAMRDRPDCEVLAVRWKKDAAALFPSVLRLGAYPALAYNLALNQYREKHSQWPDYFFTMDDDCIVGSSTFDRLAAILDAEESIGLVGAWNDLSERGRGAIAVVKHRMGEDLLQLDDQGEPFCVGGALHAIPRRTIEAVTARAPGGDLYPEVIRREDEGLTARVRDLKMWAVVATTVPVALLPDDGVDPGYRDWVLAQHLMSMRANGSSEEG